VEKNLNENFASLLLGIDLFIFRVELVLESALFFLFLIFFGFLFLFLFLFFWFGRGSLVRSDEAGSVFLFRSSEAKVSADEYNDLSNF
jgi:hypothetical protein